MKIINHEFSLRPTIKILTLNAVVVSAIVFTSLAVNAQSSVPADTETDTSKWSHESELAIVTVDGNTESESYNGKQKTTYAWDRNALVIAGRYLETKSEGIKTAKNWAASGRYERSVSAIWKYYLGHGAESDVFNGYIQKDNTDIGAQYEILKTEKQTWVAEVGYRYSHLYDINRANSYEDTGRLFTQYNHVLADNLRFEYWVEYLPNFDNPDRYFINTEPSLNVMLNKIFSLKTAYLVKYQNLRVPPNEENIDTTFTTSLVAKF